MAEPRDKQPPASIRHAMAALETLRAEDAALATTLEKSLPAYAMRLSQSGEAVDVDILLAIARQGEDALKDAFAALRPAQESGSLLEKYTKIKAEIAASNARPYSSPLLAAAPDPEKYPAAHINFMLGAAAEKGDIAAVRDMIARGADIDSNMGQALRIAVANGHTEAARLLLDHGASTDTLIPALHYAVKGGYIQTIQLALKHSLPLPLRDIDHFLYTAAAAGQTDVAALMLDLGARIHSVNHRTMLAACEHGYSDVIRLLLDRGADVHAEDEAALLMAVTHNHVGAINLLLDRGADPHCRNDAALFIAVSHGYTKATALLLDRGINAHTRNDAALRAAANAGHTSVIKIVLERGADIHADNDAALRSAATYNLPKSVEILLKNGADIGANDNESFNQAVLRGHREVVKILLEYGVDFSKSARETLKKSVYLRHKEIAALLIEYGADITCLDPDEQAVITPYLRLRANWKNTVRTVSPQGLEECDPAVFKSQFFAALLPIFKKEGYTGETGNIYAYNTMALFQNEQRLLQYLKKWARPGSHPLHDVIHMIKLPKDLSRSNLSAWGDAVLQHGPKMAQMVKYCDRLPEPLRSEDGKSWSYLRTRAEVAKYAYNRAAEHPQLAALCFAHMVDEEDFDAALDIAQAVPPKVRDMPDIIIDGKRFGLEGTTFHKLANDDVRGLFLGELTDCCQSIGNAGNDCAEHGYTSPNGGFYVIETAQGEIIGQSWAWRGEQSELCLDSLETLGARVSQQQWKDLLKEIAQELTMRKNHGVSALHVGTGGATPHAFAQAFEQATAKPVDYSGYRDSNKQVRVWKR